MSSAQPQHPALPKRVRPPAPPVSAPVKEEEGQDDEKAVSPRQEDERKERLPVQPDERSLLPAPAQPSFHKFSGAIPDDALRLFSAIPAADEGRDQLGELPAGRKEEAKDSSSHERKTSWTSSSQLLAEILGSAAVPGTAASASPLALLLPHLLLPCAPPLLLL